MDVQAISRCILSFVRQLIEPRVSLVLFSHLFLGRCLGPLVLEEGVFSPFLRLVSPCLASAGPHLFRLLGSGRLYCQFTHFCFEFEQPTCPSIQTQYGG